MHRKLFETSKVAEAYAKYRPTYGKDVYETIINFCKEANCSFQLAVDVGCGSGQSTVPLAEHFGEVIGVDVSEKQISQAPRNIANLSFRVGAAEDLSYVGTQTADLVTVAQAMHFMDLGRFYPEVERVLKPGGSFVSYGYGLSVLGDQRAEEALHHFYKGVLGQYWTEERNKVVEHYQGFSLPFPEWRRNDSLKMKRTWSVDELIGYLSSWTAWHEYLLEHPNSDAMEELRQRLKQLYRTGAGEGETERPVHVFWPVFMLMGHKPVL